MERRGSLTPKQIELVKSSWQKVLPIADTVSELFYSRLFELDPSVRHMFPDDMFGQRRTLIALLGRVVASLHRLDDVLPDIRALGVRHVGYGVRDEHYPTVRAAMLWTLEQGLGDFWTDDLRVAWAEVYGVMGETMKEGAVSDAA